MPLRDSVALVTGAAGFVGASLVRRLVAGGVRAHVVVRPHTDLWRLREIRDRLVVHTADLTDGDAVHAAVARIRPDLVFHFAKHRGNPAALDYNAAYAANLHATRHLLEAVRELPLSRFVHAGSSLEYDLSRSPLRESHAPAPLTIHGVTKAAASLLCQHFAGMHGVPAVVLRLFTVYGPWEGRARFIPVVMMAALDGDAVRLTRRGLVHDRIHVDDVVDASVRAASAAGVTGEIVNVATGVQSTNEDVVSIVERVSARAIARADEPFPDRPWDTPHWVADVSLARDRLGWQASIGLEDGLTRTYDWFARHAALYRTSRA